MVCQLVSCPSNVIRVMTTNSNCLKWLQFAGKLEDFFEDLRIFRRSKNGVMSKLRIKWMATRPSGINRLYLLVQQLAFVMIWWKLLDWTMAIPQKNAGGKVPQQWSTNCCRFFRTIGLPERRLRKTTFLCHSKRIVLSNTTRRRYSDPSKIHSGNSEKTAHAVRTFHCPGISQRSLSQLRTTQKTQQHHWKSETWSVGMASDIANKVFVQGVPK